MEGEKRDVSTVSPIGVYNTLSHSSWGTMLMDIREKEAFDASHITKSFNIPHSLPADKKKEKLAEQKISRYYGTVLVIDDGDHILEVQDLLTSELGHCKVLSLEGGFSSFHEKYPFLCTQEISSTAYGQAWPSIIQEDFLFLGCWSSATHKNALKSLNIKRIVNCTPDDPPYPDEYSYLHISIDDLYGQNIASHFEKAIEYIRDAKSKNERVLVHCHAGISRSSTIVIAYLMTENKWTLKQTIEYVKSNRRIISPNGGFLRQLSEYEFKLLGSKSMTVGEPSMYSWG